MKNLAICISLANLYFIEVWVRLIYDRSPWHFFASYSILDYMAIILNVLIIGSLLWLTTKLIHRYPKLSFLGILLFGLVIMVIVKSFTVLILKIIVSSLSRSLELVPELIASFIVALFFTISIICIISLFIILIKKRQQLTKVSQAILLIVFPFALITLSQAMLVIINNYPDYIGQERSSEFIKTGSDNKVLWIIFDEMDQRATFIDRPKALDLPHIDRFTEEAIFAKEAYPPAGSTIKSIPALISGRAVTEVKSSTFYDIELLYEDSKDIVTWSSQISIFQETKKLGLSTSAGGYYIPYHIVFEDYLDTYISGWRGEPSIMQRMYFQISDVLPFIDNTRKRVALAHQSILQNTIKVIKNPNINLIYVHFVPPHKPSIYDRNKDDYNYSVISGLRSSPKGHFDNLVLVDLTIGKLHEAMESEDLWDQTTILISSDHWWRSSHEFDGITDHRVPFLLKLAGQTESIVFETPFNTLLSHDLILSILRNDLSTPDEISDWLERNHLRYEIPDYVER